MAIAFDNTGDSGWVSQSTGWTYPYTVGVANDRILIVNVFTSPAGDTISAVTYAGVAMTNLYTVTDTNNNGETSFYLLNPASGTNNIQVTQSGTFNAEASIISYSGVSQISFPDAGISNAGSLGTTLLQETITAIGNPVWTVEFCRQTNSGWSVSVSGVAQTLRINAGVGMSFWDSNGDITGATSITADWTNATSLRIDGPVFVSMLPAPSTALPDNAIFFGANF